MLSENCLNYCKSGTATLLALTLGVTAVTPMLSIAPAEAQVFRTQRYLIAATKSVVIPSGTKILVEYNKDKILVTKQETMPLTVTVAEDVKVQNNIVIPRGTQVEGQIEPYRGGSRFVAKQLIFNENNKQSLNATSEVVTKTEQVKKGAGAGTILQGAAIGAAAATVVAAMTGDRAIATEEVLGGAGLGALGGFFLGKKKVDLISINPNQDLDLTLRSDLTLKLQ